jgi:hypothetical protein
MQSLLLEPPATISRPSPDKLVNEKRVAARIPAALVPLITGLRLSPCGGKTSLVNISATGVAVKSDTGVKLGSVVTVNLDGGLPGSQIRGRVVRCGVSAIESGVIAYLIGIAFDKPISIERLQVASVEPSVPVSPQSPLAAAVLFNRW